MDYKKIELSDIENKININVSINNRIVTESELNFLIGKIIINGYTDDNNSKNILIGEKLYFVDEMTSDSYQPLSLPEGKELVIVRVE